MFVVSDNWLFSFIRSKKKKIKKMFKQLIYETVEATIVGPQKKGIDLVKFKGIKIEQSINFCAVRKKFMQ